MKAQTKLLGIYIISNSTATTTADASVTPNWGYFTLSIRRVVYTADIVHVFSFLSIPCIIFSMTGNYELATHRSVIPSLAAFQPRMIIVLDPVRV